MFHTPKQWDHLIVMNPDMTNEALGYVEHGMQLSSREIEPHPNEISVLNTVKITCTRSC
jgi:hypothetical protein